MSLEESLEEAGKRYVQRIRENLASTGTDASGETSRSVGYRVYEEGNKTVLVVTGGRPFFPTVETGSKKSDKNPHPDMIDKIKKWMPYRGLQGSPWGIAKNILRFGSKLWQRGGRKDIYSDVRMEAFREIPRILARVTKEELVNR